jgi:acetyl-CoA C-acetyltransferase
MSQQEVYVISGRRTAIGSYGGSLKDVELRQLASEVMRAAVGSSGLAAEDVGHVVVGNVIPTQPSDAYLSRSASVDAGMSHETPAFNVNRLCGSGLQAIVSAAQAIALGDVEVAIGAGAESMSRGIHASTSTRFGARLGDAALLDYVTGALHDPFQRIHMGITAENVSERYGITREQQDALAVESQRRAARAITEGRFHGQIVPIQLKPKGGARSFEVDEHVRGDVELEQLARMKPVFKEGGTVTAGNASGLNDGAAAVVLASGTAVGKRGLKPMARLVAYAHTGVDPAYMGIGPVSATRAVLKRAGIALADVDVIEANEAFAAQACAVAKELELDPSKVNPNGSGISLGHPIGATGAIITVKALHELERIAGRYALVTMCIGGGQGIAALFERA